MKLFALLVVAVSLVLVGCNQSSTETAPAKGSNAVPAASNAPAAK